jgi:hypothetical protein
MEAWQIYMDEFRARGERASAQAFGREQGLAEAAHEAYRVTSNRLTQHHGWEDERALVVLRGFNAAVQEWVERGAADWTALEGELTRREAGLRDGI